MPKPLKFRGRSLQVTTSQLFFLASTLALGVSLGTALPFVAMVAPEWIAPIYLKIASPYIGGVGIGLTVGGVGMFFGSLLHGFFRAKSLEIANGGLRSELTTSGGCFVIGAIFVAWYLASYMRPS